MQDWLNFLEGQGLLNEQDPIKQSPEGQGALSADPPEGVENVGPATLITGSQSLKIPLLEHGLIVVQGPDSQKFLQGQLTCDVRLAADGQLIRGAHCNAQGRMLSSFWCFSLGADTIALRVPKDNMDAAWNALKKYSVFSKVTITQSDWVGFLSTSSTSQTGIASVSNEADRVTLHHTDGSVEYWGSPESLRSIWESSTELAPAPPHYATLWHVQQGIADVHPATFESYLPQQFLLHLTDGVSFKKGCYTGQEIVARIHYKGQVKRQLCRIQLPLESPHFAPGDSLKNKQGKEVGQVLEAAYSQNTNEALVCVPTELFNETDNVTIADFAVKICVLELPYAIPKEATDN